MRLIDFFAGVCRFSVAEGDAVRLLNILMKARLVYCGFTVTGRETDGETGGEPGGTAVLFCSARTAHRLAVLCDAAGIGHSVRTVYGLPAMKKTLIRRAGLIAGSLAALFILILGESVIWDVRVTGCRDILTSTETEALFAELGVRPGVRRRAVNADRTAAEAVKSSDKLAWAAVNIRGTTAVIEVREQLDPPKEDEPDGGYDGENLIAACDGLITGTEIIAGKPAVSRGQSVKKGDLLVSGVIDSTRIGVRITRARGEVRAETVREITVTVPYRYERNVPDGREDEEISLIFFSKEIKLFSKSGGAEHDSDTVSERNMPRLPGGKVIPVGIDRVKRVGYSAEEAVRSGAEAERLADFELSRRISDALSGGAYPVRKTVVREVGEDAVTLRCELVAVENIAVPQGFVFLTGGDG